MVDRKDSWTFRECRHCRALARLLDELAPDWADDGVSADTIDAFEPETWTQARWIVQWRRKWTRRNGSLYPIPGAAE